MFFPPTLVALPILAQAASSVTVTFPGLDDGTDTYFSLGATFETVSAGAAVYDLTCQGQACNFDEYQYTDLGSGQFILVGLKTESRVTSSAGKATTVNFVILASLSCSPTETSDIQCVQTDASFLSVVGDGGSSQTIGETVASRNFGPYFTRVLKVNTAGTVVASPITAISSSTPTATSVGTGTGASSSSRAASTTAKNNAARCGAVGALAGAAVLVVAVLN
jgi:hypothetical protein